MKFLRLSHTIRVLTLAALIYLGIFLCIFVLFRLSVLRGELFSSELGSDDLTYPFSVLFFLYGGVFALLTYGVNSLVAKKFIHIDLSRALVYMSVCGLVGGLGEYMINSSASMLFDVPAYVYHIAPVHNGYTSLVMLALWPTYGFHMYCFHEVIAGRGNNKFSDLVLAIIMGIDGVVMEFLVNVLSVMLFSVNIFYYTLGDLAHITSVVIFPCYILLGYIGVRIAHKVERQKQRTIYICFIFLMTGIFFLMG